MSRLEDLTFLCNTVDICIPVRESKFVTFVTVKVLLCGKMVLNSQMVIGSMSNLN